MSSTITKVLIANRGEIALRVIRTVRDLGLQSVAVYCDEDRNAPFVRLADEAYSLDGSGFADTYLNADKILDVAYRTGANAIHPGYGFLSENADFARRCEEVGVKWLGPSGDAIDALGDKVKARKVAEAAQVSPVPGISDFIEGPDVVRGFIAQHGYPVILKRADGGGGHGITVVRTELELNNFLTAHSHDLGYYFIERFVENARHVETQCARDVHGNFTVVSTRDCSVQRRNQKLVEEAPAPFLNDQINEQLFIWSKSLFETVNYHGLGTCEYLLETKQDGTKALYFLEVNPRLQVEHTVSEEVSGLDLVAEQIKIGNGDELTKIGNLAPTSQGCSIELRITSEDPLQGMTPTAGVVSKIEWPMGQGIRLESGITVGDTVTTDFDSMVAKIVITADSRPQAISRVKRALKELEIIGISTPKELFKVIFDSSDFTGIASENAHSYVEDANVFQVSTKWLENKILPNLEHLINSSELSNTNDDVSATSEVQQEPDEMHEFVVELDGKRTTLKLPDSLLGSLGGGKNFGSGFASGNQNGQSRRLAPRIGSDGRSSSSFLRRDGSSADAGAVDIADPGDPSLISSPMQGIVVSVVVQKGQQVQKGDLVVVLEAMKMENFVHAAADGVVGDILVEASDSVEKGQTLVTLELDN
jgi:acetyl-CoA/propionyl-CoA carboxylase biotin carboxyl carrier protein